MRLLFRLSLTVLSFLLILAVLWLSLPRLIVALTHNQLTQLGFSDIELVIGNIGLQSASVERMHVSNEEYSLKLQGLETEYHFTGLLSGSVDSLAIDQLALTRLALNKNDSALPDPVLLLAFLKSPWDEYIPTHSLNINKLSIFDENGVLLTRSSVEIDKQGKDFSGEINLTDSNEESYLVSLDLSPESGFSLQLQSLSAAENEVGPVSVILKPADGMDGLSGKVNIDLSSISRLLTGNDGLSGEVLADLSYVARVDKPEKDFSVDAEIKDVQYESLLVKGISINLQGSIGGKDNGHSIAFEDSSSLLIQSLQQESSGFERLRLQLPHSLDIEAGKLLIPGNSGASITLNNVLLDDINIPEMQFRDIVLAGNQVDKGHVSCSFKSQLLAPVVKKSDLHIKALPIQLDGSCPDAEKEMWSVNAVTASLISEDNDFLLPLEMCKLQLGNIVNKKPPHESATEFAGQLQCASGKQSGAVSSSFRFSPDNGTGHASYSVSDIKPDGETPLAATLLKNWEEPYDLVSGNLSVNGKYRWWKSAKGNDRENLLMDLKLKDGGGYYEGILFSGLDYSDQIELLPYIKSSGFSDIAIRDVDVGIPVTSTKASIRYSRSKKGPLPLITVNALSMSLLDGKVQGNDLLFDMNNEINDVVLVVNGLDMAEIAELQKLDGLSVTGRLDGYIPVTITTNGVKITEGKIVAQQQGGQIHYRPQGGTVEMEKSAVGSEFVFRIIEDMKYDSLTIEVNYKEDGDMDMKLAIKGKSPKVDEHRPVHFNLNLQQNVLKLLRGLRYAEGLSEEIDKNVQKHFHGGQLK